MSSSPFSRRLLLAVAGSLVAWACASPTLPLPPPSRPQVAGPDATGTVSLSGYVPGKSRAFAINTGTSVIGGQETGDDGYYNFRLQAKVGDEVGFWYRNGTLDSQTVYFRITAPANPGGTGGGGPGGAGGAGGEGGSN